MNANPAAAAPLVVAVEAAITATAEVDLVRFYAHLHAEDQADYAALDLAEWGYTEEHERPLAYLMSRADGAIDLLSGRGVKGSWSDLCEIEAQVRDRGGPRLHGAAARWTRGDYDALCDAVPWLAEHRASLGLADTTLAWPHLSRVPGPLDTPLIPAPSESSLPNLRRTS